ncbi:ATP-binding protein [Alkalibacter rhizosphaerae]|uniref:ATP-binding protein n=1 Tax=Alkalibacter rhizosphaerae TaxID=2815577 RepID=A0A974XEE0_9FIRM|nr:ATP-binding protein [Alkalibacter rhizosphaerae]QSX08322.1 ATP-binding protein [Alkalibacter rhizosphaerae]
MKQLKVYHQLMKDPGVELYRTYILEKNKDKQREIAERMIVYLLDHGQKKDGIFSWKDYIAQRVLADENLFSMGAEQRRPMVRPVLQMTLSDLYKIQQMMKTTWTAYGHAAFDLLNGIFQEKDTNPFVKLSTADLFKWLKKFHEQNGTGIFTSSYVFKLTTDGTVIGVDHFEKVSFQDLIGYQRQMDSIRENVESFLHGKGFNNMLLYGDRGTGKSSSVKALLHEYKEEGLAVIEMKKDQFIHFSNISNTLRGRRQKCMVFIDDLSFEPSETSYKELKAVLEGSFESKPENIMMVVTSNRRHLIKESFADRETDIHVRETIGEQLSLFDRFGLIVYFDQPGEALFQEMVLEMASREGIVHSEEELLALANRWKVEKGTKSGRSVRQFIDSLKRQ